ncbi:unnamed protein product [Cyprideis torosa]|uniref:DNA-directed RNA polymerases I and III subunit RPAC1 n=1 Tax=Cyprideis torosa TaxID=163714 RepID=A0A7R8W9F1_9CRUS|nr:unnamed protein product [Cyprideis torosa]CAG0889752.1 unnamed protein product [Cyprideis torosa]
MEDFKDRLRLGEFEASTPDSLNVPGTFVGVGVDDSWNLKKFKKKFRITVVQLEGREMEFDMIGIDCSLVNTLRRVLLSNVPSMAIEKVYMYNNTSVIQDEVLSHRLGLIPLKADARLFEFPSKTDELSGTDSLMFELKIKCTRSPSASRSGEGVDPDALYVNHSVYSKHLSWIPVDEQQRTLYTAKQVGPIDPDILIAKMRPGHEIDCKLVAVKGIGSDHAKFSPVCTAYYRLLPEVRLTAPVQGEDAELLKTCFSPGVIEIDEDGRAKVVDARYDSCSRNVFRHEHLKDKILMTKKKDHFIFSVESVGALRPDELVVEGLNFLIAKCDYFLLEEVGHLMQ